MAQTIQEINPKLRPGQVVAATHFTRWGRIICDMVPVSLFFPQVMAPVGGLTLPMARSAAIPGVNMGRLAVTTAGWSLAELMNPWRSDATTEAG